MNPERILNLAYNYSLNLNTNALRPLRRALESIPAVREELARSGGFEAVVDQAIFTPAAQSALTSLYGVNAGLVTSDRVGNDCRNIPTVQEENELLGNLVNVTTGIKTHLDECCDEIKLLLKDLKVQIRDVHVSLKTQIDKGVSNITIHIRSVKRDLISFYEVEKEKLKAFLLSLKAEIYNEIRSIVAQENRTILNKISNLENQLNSINRNINSTHGTVRHVEEMLGGYLLEWGNYRVTYYNDHNKIVGDIAAATTEINGEVLFRTRTVNKNVTFRINQVTKNVENHVDSKFKEQTDFLKDVDEGLPSILTKEICCNIVGESYSKWDSISMYYPTLVFVFNEITENNKPRRSQIKLRFNKLSEQVTTQDLELLISRIKSQPTIQYVHGPVKGNYVSRDKRFKTTVFGKDSDSISSSLESLFVVIPEPFDKGLLSVTSIGKKRPSITKRSKDLFNLGLNLADYNQEFRMELKSVSILVNGISKIIKLV